MSRRADDASEAESELAFGGLHQLCAPFSDRYRTLPAPQRIALEVAFGLSSGDPPDRFLIGLAVLNLLATATDDGPLVCLIDDAQWLDQVSAQTLAFVARRVLAEGLLILFAMREPVDGHPLQDLPRLEIGGLNDRDSRTLLASSAPGRMDPQVRERVLAEARGNPLALLELPRGLVSNLDSSPRSAEIPLASQLENEFQRRLEALSSDARLMMLLAAAEPVGDTALLRRAAQAIDVDLDEASAEAQQADLVSTRMLIRFRHPLVRSAALRSGSQQEHQLVHRALADATDPDLDPDRRVWHLSNAAPGPDETVAAALEQASTRARSRGGVAAAAAFLKRAAELTPDPRRRGSRALSAAQAKSQAGEYDEAIDLLDGIQLEPLSDHDRAQADLVRGRILFASQSAATGLPTLLAAAKRLERSDAALATETYRDAIHAALTAGTIGGDAGLRDVASAILAMPAIDGPPGATSMLEGLARVVVKGYGDGVSFLRQGLDGHQRGGLTVDQKLGWYPLACRMAHDSWNFEAWSSLSRELLDVANEAGALAVLPSALLLRLSNRIFAGDLGTAEALVQQSVTLGEVTGSSFFANYGALVTAPWRGDESETRSVIDAVTHDVRLDGEGKVSTATAWAAAVLYNGMGDFDRAFAAARRGVANPGEMGLSTWSMFELVEAATRLGRLEDATGAAAHLLEVTHHSGTAWARGTSHLVSAMMSQDATRADEHYAAAVSEMERTEVRMLAARAHLSYGEWLRRQGRRTDARIRLLHAHAAMSQMGASGFAERARHGLAAVGVSTRDGGRVAATGVPLTVRELQIAKLAAAGLTNPEIGGQMFISAHTVEFHLRKVFTKLGIRSRRDIASVLAE